MMRKNFFLIIFLFCYNCIALLLSLMLHLTQIGKMLYRMQWWWWWWWQHFIVRIATIMIGKKWIGKKHEQKQEEEEKKRMVGTFNLLLFLVFINNLSPQRQKSHSLIHLSTNKTNTLDTFVKVNEQRRKVIEIYFNRLYWRKRNGMGKQINMNRMINQYWSIKKEREKINQ